MIKGGEVTELGFETLKRLKCLFFRDITPLIALIQQEPLRSPVFCFH